MIYSINGTEYEVRVAASGDYCVTVSRYAEEPETYNLGSEIEALKFILSDCEVFEDEDDGYESNMPCDTYGPAACNSSCANYARCQGWEK